MKHKHPNDILWASVWTAQDLYTSECRNSEQREPEQRIGAEYCCGSDYGEEICNKKWGATRNFPNVKRLRFTFVLILTKNGGRDKDEFTNKVGILKKTKRSDTVGASREVKCVAPSNIQMGSRSFP